MLMDTNFASAFYFSQINAGIKLPASQYSPVRTKFPTCHCTHIDETFIDCEQSQASERGLQQDVTLTNQQTLSETVSETQISHITLINQGKKGYIFVISMGQQRVLIL